MYFDENVLIEFSKTFRSLENDNIDVLREKLRTVLSGKIIGDNKFISVDRIENLRRKIKKLKETFYSSPSFIFLLRT